MKPAARNHPLDDPLSECLFRGLCNFTVTSWWDWKSHEPREQGRTGHAAQIQNVGDKQKIIHPISTLSLSRFRWISKDFSDSIFTAFWQCWRTLKSFVSPARQILCTHDAQDWTAALCSDVNCWTPHSACRSTFSGGTCRGTLLHCLIGSHYCLTSSTQWCTVGLDPKMELLNKLHNIHLCECSFSIKHQISVRFLLISNACNKLSTNLFLFHYDVFQVCLGVWEVCQGHDREMPCTAIQDVCRLRISSSENLKTHADHA